MLSAYSRMQTDAIIIKVKRGKSVLQYYFVCKILVLFLIC